MEKNINSQNLRTLMMDSKVAVHNLFEQKKIHEKLIKDLRNLLDTPGLSPSEAVCGFCKWLVEREEDTIFTNMNSPDQYLDLIKRFCKANNLQKPEVNWKEKVIIPK